MPLVLAHNVNVATHLTSNISIAVRTSTTSSTVSVPIAAIAGGTAAGVVLAVVVVIGWRWWTSIVRNTNKRQSSGVRFHVSVMSLLFIVITSKVS